MAGVSFVMILAKYPGEVRDLHIYKNLYLYIKFRLEAGMLALI